MSGIGEVLMRPVTMVTDYYSGKGEKLPSVDVEYDKTVLFVPPPMVQAAFSHREFGSNDISVLMAMLKTNEAHWNLQTAQKVVRKTRWGEHMRSMRETTVGQERWNNLASSAGAAAMIASAVSPKIADAAFGNRDRDAVWLVKQFWDRTGLLPQEAIRKEEWRNSFMGAVKAAPQMVQGFSQTTQQTGQMEVQVRGMQTQAEQEAMRSSGEAASGIKQDDRSLRELIERTFIQGDPNTTIIRIANGN